MLSIVKYWKYGIIGILVFICILLYLRLNKVTDEFYDYRLTVKVLGEQQAFKIKQLEERQKHQTEVIVNSYNEAEKQIRDYYENNPTIKYRTIIKRVREDSTGCSSTSGTSESSEAVGEATGRVAEVAPAPIEEEILNFELMGKEIVQCIELINFNIKQDALN